MNRSGQERVEAHLVTLGCPVGHPSGPGRHCPLCGRDYVRLEAPARHALVPAPRQSVEIPVVPDTAADLLAPKLEVYAMLASLASDADA